MKFSYKQLLDLRLFSIAKLCTIAHKIGNTKQITTVFLPKEGFVVVLKTARACIDVCCVTEVALEFAVQFKEKWSNERLFSSLKLVTFP